MLQRIQDYVAENEETNCGTTAGEDGRGRAISLRKLRQDVFRTKLVEHFAIKWTRGEVVWPQSRGEKRHVAYFET